VGVEAGNEHDVWWFTKTEHHFLSLYKLEGRNRHSEQEQRADGRCKQHHSRF
jgi:hypothetical protein